MKKVKTIRFFCEYVKNISTFVAKQYGMEIKFDKKYLSEMYYKGQSSDKKHHFQPQVVRKYQRCIDLLEGATSIETLYQYNALNYEVLKGGKAGISSINKKIMANLGYGFYPTHPGEILKDEIEYRGVSQKKLAAEMKMSYTVLNEILIENEDL
ncbi:hypothetical protein FACS1894177_08470 [Bacteroidia bacterium]|nr:hypothetical protein FACS1894177_08470 [Bacteroidia bacterium]